MFLGMVVGELVATLKHAELVGRRLLWIERVDPYGRATGKRILAVDSVDAGEGDAVLVVDEGNSAAQILKRPRGPVRTVIVGVVDEVILPAPLDERNARGRA